MVDACPINHANLVDLLAGQHEEKPIQPNTLDDDFLVRKEQRQPLLGHICATVEAPRPVKRSGRVEDNRFR